MVNLDQPSLDPFKLRTTDNVFILWRQVRNLLLDLFDPTLRRGVGSKETRKFTRLVLLPGLKLFKEGNEPLRIVISVPEVLCPQLISLCFRLSGNSQNGQIQAQTQAILNSNPSQASSHEKSGKGRKLQQLTFRHPLSGMTGSDVGNLMSQYSRQFRLVVRFEN